MSEEELRIVLVGRTGEGKSAIGNALLGKDIFKSKSAMKSVTATTGAGAADRFGTKLHVIDTPGFFDTTMTNEQIKKEIVKSVGVALPGPHIFLLVIACERFTAERQNTLKQLEKMFSENGATLHPYTIVVFSKMRLLDEGQALDEFVSGADEALTKFMADCDGRYRGIETRGENAQEQAKQIIDLCLTLKTSGKGKYYADDLTRAIDEILKKLAPKFGLSYSDARFKLLDESSQFFIAVFAAAGSVLTVIFRGIAAAAAAAGVVVGAVAAVTSGFASVFASGWNALFG